MKREKDSPIYEAPEIRVIELILEQLILTSSDPSVTNPDMGWGD